MAIYSARYYDPTTGRFLSQDLLTFLGGINFYVYAGNRPAVLVDPLGLQEGWNDYQRVGNIITLARANSMANEALAAAQEWAKQRGLPPSSLHNGAADAFRHCFWSCTMAHYLGEGVAETIADEHERQGNRDGQPHNEELMDRANNAVGRVCGVDDKKNCWDACTDRYNQGLLYGLGAHALPAPNQGGTK